MLEERTRIRMEDKTVDVDTLEGERWFPEERSFIEDLPLYWGDWGCASEVGSLKAVLLRRPGAEIENFDYRAVRFREPVDPEKCRKQHDALADFYRERGVRVYYVEDQRNDRPNALFCRDHVFMTPEGAILTRPAIAARRGEERYAAEALIRLGVPIIKTISGNGYFEGANAMWVDRKTVILSTSSRTNREGFQQVETELRRMGVEEIIDMQIPYGHAHIDGLLNIASDDTVVIHAPQTPYEVVDKLKRKGYRIIEAPSLTEVEFGSGTNFVALNPGEVVMSITSPRTTELMEKAGIKVHTLDLTELQKGGGCVHCMTAALKRDDC